MEKINDQLKIKFKDNQLKEKIEDKKFDTEYYQKKCEILEKNMKDVTSKYSKEISNYKTKMMERDAEIILNNDSFIAGDEGNKAIRQVC